MNSNFSLQKQANIELKRKLHSSKTILLDGFIVIYSNKPDILYKLDPRCICIIYQLAHMCICLNIHLEAPLMYDVIIVYIYTRIYGIYIYIYIHTGIYVCMYIICVYIYIYNYTYIHIYVCISYNTGKSALPDIHTTSMGAQHLRVSAHVSGKV